MNNDNSGKSGVRDSNDTGLKASSASNNFLRKDIAGLVRVLRVIEKAGKDGISTRELCEQTFKTKNYGMRVIGRAYDDGYIRRFGKNKRGYNKGYYPRDKREKPLS